MKSKRIGSVVLLAAWLLATPAFAGPVRYVAADMGYLDSRPDYIQLLDANLIPVSSFATGFDWPNALAVDGSNIYVGYFWLGGWQVVRYDFSGALLGSWSDPGLEYVQGMTMVGGELAVLNGDLVNPQIIFYDPRTGLPSHAISGPGITETIEGLAYDGSVVWALGDTLLGLDPLTGATLFSLPNVAYTPTTDPSCFHASTGQRYLWRVCGNWDGTALATNGPGELVIGALGGDWYRVSKIDGSLIASGNNGLNIMGLDEVPAEGSPVPEPASLLLFGTGLVGLRAWRKRRG